MSKKLSVAVTLVLSIIIGASAARAAEIKLLTTGAFKPEVLALVPDFEKQAGDKTPAHQNECTRTFSPYDDINVCRGADVKTRL